MCALHRLWEDSHGVLHCVTHGGGWGQPFGFAYFSTDGGEARLAIVFHNCLLCAKIGHLTGSFVLADLGWVGE